MGVLMKGNKMETITLVNGEELPAIGYGSAIVHSYMFGHKNKYKYWIKNCFERNKQFKKDITLPKILRTERKYKPMLIDTSRAYAGSEKVIGRTLAKYKREDYKICTKLCNYHQFHENVREGLETSLQMLKMEYVDLYLMHWPVPEKFLSSWKQMEVLYKEGKCKAIGVCNCNIRHLEQIEKIAEIKPMVNQIECHPLFVQQELREYCKKHNIQVMAYTPTARMDDRLNKTVLPSISQKYGKTIAQIILRWHVQTGNIPIVNTSNLKHLKEDMSIFDFSLTDEEIGNINHININSRLRFDPENVDYTKI